MRKYMHARIIVCFIGVMKKLKLDNYAKFVILLDGKKKKKGDLDDLCGSNRAKRKVSAKMVRYFPLKPRLQRLFLSSKIAKDMIWHSLDTNNDGLVRHPRDSKAWKHFDLINS